jgi:hypothetical protein
LGAFKLPRHRIAFSFANPCEIILPGSPKTCPSQHCRAHSKSSNLGLQIPTSSLVWDLNYQGTELLSVLLIPGTIILQVHQNLLSPSLPGSQQIQFLLDCKFQFSALE